MTSTPSKQEEELWEAALNDDGDTIKASEADVNSKTPLGNTALHIAASGGCLYAVKTLLDKGADVDCLDSNGLTPLFKAVNESEALVADYLLSYGAVASGVDETKMSLLHWAAMNGMTSVVRQLLSKEEPAGVHGVNSKEECGKTPLHFACKEGHLPTVKLLLDSGADPSSKDDIHWTPVHEAAFWGHLQVVRCLLEAGVEINSKTEDGETPLNFSHYNGNSAISELLRINGGIQ